MQYDENDNTVKEFSFIKNAEIIFYIKMSIFLQNSKKSETYHTHFNVKVNN